jgi:hypothetical protein
MGFGQQLGVYLGLREPPADLAHDRRTALRSTGRLATRAAAWGVCQGAVFAVLSELLGWGAALIVGAGFGATMGVVHFAAGRAERGQARARASAMHAPAVRSRPARTDP